MQRTGRLAKNKNWRQSASKVDVHNWYMIVDDVIEIKASIWGRDAKRQRATTMFLWLRYEKCSILKLPTYNATNFELEILDEIIKKMTHKYIYFDPNMPTNKQNLFKSIS